MSCERLERKIVAYVDGQASDSERHTVEAHLESCAACRARVKGFRGVWAVLGELPNHEPSAAFDTRLQARLAAEPARQTIWGWLMPAPRFALAVALLAAFSIWISSRTPTQVIAPVSVPATAQAQGSDNDFSMIKDLQVLENYDVLANFDALSQLPSGQAGPGNND